MRSISAPTSTTPSIKSSPPLEGAHASPHFYFERREACPVGGSRRQKENAVEDMETFKIPDVSVQAYIRLLELNLGAWKPDVENWLHSAEAREELRELLAFVPCSPTVH